MAEDKPLGKVLPVLEMYDDYDRYSTFVKDQKMAR
jgi:hypothetical protein